LSHESRLNQSGASFTRSRASGQHHFSGAASARKVRILGRIGRSAPSWWRASGPGSSLRRYTGGLSDGSGETLGKVFLFSVGAANRPPGRGGRSDPKRLSDKSFRLTVARAVLL